MNTLELNKYTTAWREWGASVERPRAVLAVSAHWFTRGVGVTAMERPRTIHDFGGFPDELFAVEYPAAGDPELASEVAQLLASGPSPVNVGLDQQWGLDHGTWSVLAHVFPDADVPVVQLSIDGTRSASWHWDLATRLAPLRESGVMVLGSGNVTHNFGEIDMGATHSADWAVEFDDFVWSAVEKGDRRSLVEYEAHRWGRRAVPTPDHYLPLLYVAGLAQPGERATTIVEGMDLGSFSMRSFVIS